jgi:hypothetical protein
VEKPVRHLAQVFYESRGGVGPVLDHLNEDDRACSSVFDAGLAWYSVTRSEASNGND